MGKEVRSVSEAPSVGGEAGGIGHYLASQRRLRGITLEELCALTKIPQRSLVRLESGAFDVAPDGFVRGFVRAVAVALGLDPDEAVMRLMREPEAQAEPAPGGFERRTLLLVLLLGVVVLGLAAGVWQLATRRGEPAPPQEEQDVILRRDPVRALAGEEPAPEAVEEP